MKHKAGARAPAVSSRLCHVLDPQIVPDFFSTKYIAVFVVVHTFFFQIVRRGRDEP